MVEHRSSESEGLRFDSSWGLWLQFLREFFLCPTLVTRWKTSFFTNIFFLIMATEIIKRERRTRHKWLLMQYLLLTLFHTRKEDISLEESGSQSEVTWKPFLYNPSIYSPHHIFLKQPPTLPLSQWYYFQAVQYSHYEHSQGGGGDRRKCFNNCEDDDPSLTLSHLRVTSILFFLTTLPLSLTSWSWE